MSNSPQPGISRRTLAMGAAWSVPAVALTAAAPALAASCVPVAISATCSALSFTNTTVTFTVTSTNGQPIPAGSTFVSSVSGINLSSIAYGGSLYDTSAHSGGSSAMTMVTTTAASSYTFTMKPVAGLLNLGIATFSLCATGGGVCSGTCATKKVEYKTVLGVGAAVCL